MTTAPTSSTINGIDTSALWDAVRAISPNRCNVATAIALHRRLVVS
jgi:hypothetical protein